MSRDPWWEQASCASSDPDAWYLIGEKDDSVLASHLRRICEACPVLQPCLKHARREEGSDPIGFRAGMTANQRRLYWLKEAQR